MSPDLASTHVRVFAPYRDTPAGPVSEFYGDDVFKAQVADWLASVCANHAWVEVTPANVRREVARVREQAARRAVAVLNLCDGIDVDGYPGIETVRALEAARLPFTGAGSKFYALSTSKTAMKRRMMAAGVATSPFVVIIDAAVDGRRAGTELGYPLIIKPDVSAASYGISLASVVHDERACVTQAAAALSGERDPASYYEGVFAERFIPGRELTVLCVSDERAPGGVFVYPPVERVFHPALPRFERMLSYDRYWERYECEAPLPDRAPVYSYASVPSRWSAALADLARSAYLALDGDGYARVDVRWDERTDELVVLEVNCNCGLSTDGQTSVSHILRLSGETMSGLMERVLRDAMRRAPIATRAGADVSRR